MNVLFQSFLLVLLSFTFVFAQDRPDPNKPQGKNFEVPEGWLVRLDHEMEEVIIGAQPDSSDIYFVNMTPGWHITTGPAGIFYHPANTATGNFTINSEIHFFDPGDRNREGYGVFWGGSNLEDANQQYGYFLLRNTGEFLIKKRTGDETQVLQGWTPSESILVYEENSEESSVQNVLSIVKNNEELTFFINGEQVAAISSDMVESDGIFGMRANHSVNLHISALRLMSNQ